MVDLLTTILRCDEGAGCVVVVFTLDMSKFKFSTVVSTTRLVPECCPPILLSSDDCSDWVAASAVAFGLGGGSSTFLCFFVTLIGLMVGRGLLSLSSSLSSSSSSDDELESWRYLTGSRKRRAWKITSLQ